MIRSKKDYIYYLECDRVALVQSKDSGVVIRIKNWILCNKIWKFQKLLRKAEYVKNCKQGIIGKVCYSIILFRFKRLSLKLGFSIPLNVFGPGLSIAHYGTIVVNGGAKVGRNCRLHTCVNIGTQAGSSNLAPIIGDNVYIGPGAKLFGPIVIGNDIAIGANSVVTKSFEENHITIVGAPARKISDKGSEGFMIKAN